MKLTMDTSGDFGSPRLEEALDISVERVVAALQKDMLEVWRKRSKLWAAADAPGVVYFDSDRDAEDLQIRFSIREVVRDLLDSVPKKLDATTEKWEVAVDAASLSAWSKYLAAEARKLEKAAKAVAKWEQLAEGNGK